MGSIGLKPTTCQRLLREIACFGPPLDPRPERDEVIHAVRPK